MHLEAKGLRGNNPCDMLAALGLLRAWDCQWPEHQAKLRFDPEGLHAILDVPEMPEVWAEVLLEGIRGVAPRLIYGHPTEGVIKCLQPEFRSYLQAAVDQHEGDGWGSLPLAMFSAYAAETGTDPKTGIVDATDLSFANGGGKQYLFGSFCALKENITAELLRSAIEGLPEAMVCDKTKFKRFRWDPSELRSHAMMDKNPDDSAVFTRPGVNFLAFLGMSFFPVVHSARGCMTTGVGSRGREDFFQWPLWATPIVVDEVRSLLATPNVAGCFSKYESRQITVNKSKYFLPASICA